MSGPSGQQLEQVYEAESREEWGLAPCGRNVLPGTREIGERLVPNLSLLQARPYETFFFDRAYPICSEGSMHLLALLSSGSQSRKLRNKLPSQLLKLFWAVLFAPTVTTTICLGSLDHLWRLYQDT
jgi:hypothetical protein